MENGKWADRASAGFNLMALLGVTWQSCVIVADVIDGPYRSARGLSVAVRAACARGQRPADRLLVWCGGPADRDRPRCRYRKEWPACCRATKYRGFRRTHSTTRFWAGLGIETPADSYAPICLVVARRHARLEEPTSRASHYSTPQHAATRSPIVASPDGSSFPVLCCQRFI